MVPQNNRQALSLKAAAQSHSMVRDIVYGVGGLLLGLLVLGGVWLWAGRAGPSFPTLTEVQPYAAPTFTAKTPDGATVRLDAFKGRPVLLNFWASWCQPCKEETPALETVYQQLKGDGLVIVGVDVFKTEPGMRDVQGFVARYGMSYPVVLDETDTISNDYAVASLPTSYFIDPQGQVRYVRIGTLDATEIEQVFRRLQMK